MGNIVASRAFLPPRGSYTEELEGFLYINSKLGDQVPATFYRTTNPRFTILFSHGNAEDIGQMSNWMIHLANYFRVDIIAYDYRGYGLHQGVPSEASCYADIEAVYNYLTTTIKVSPEKIILFGRSLGSGPTVHLASTLCSASKRGSSWWSSSLFCRGDAGGDDVDLPPPLAGVILQSPISSCIRVVSNVLAQIPIDMFVNINKIHKIDVPVLIIHGTADEVVPYDHGKELHARCPNAYKLLSLEGAGHNNIECDFMDQLLAGLDQYFKFLRERRRTKSFSMETKGKAVITNNSSSSPSSSEAEEAEGEE
jgi:pimeloyl-ACP methyl ester carboxylesterase